MKLDQDVLRGAYFGTRVVSREQLAAAVKLLGIFAEHLANLRWERDGSASSPASAGVSGFLSVPLMAAAAQL